MQSRGTSVKHISLGNLPILRRLFSVKMFLLPVLEYKACSVKITMFCENCVNHIYLYPNVQPHIKNTLPAYCDLKKRPGLVPLQVVKTVFSPISSFHFQATSGTCATTA